MDCPQCGYALTAFDKDCARCRRIAAEEFAKSPAAVWPPAIGPQRSEPPPTEILLSPRPVAEDPDNSSGEERGGPPEIEALHWNWGAFFCGWLWCFFHKTVGLALLVIAAGLLLALFNIFILPAGYALPSELMALVLFGLCCYLGMHGHQFAWERRRFPGGVSQYLAVQRAWAVAGGAAFGVSLLFCVIFGLFFLAAFRAYEARQQAAYQAAHPPLIPAPVSSAPPPVVLQRPQPTPIPMPPPTGRQGDDHPGDFQRHFNPNYRPNYRRDFDPRFSPSPPPPEAVPPPSQSPIPAVPQPMGEAQPNEQAPRTSNAPNAGTPSNQAVPASPPAANPPAAMPN